MKKLNFLGKLKKEGKLEIVEESKEICESYELKSEESLKSAELLLLNDLLETAVGLAYYSMYHITIALMRLSGVKCENHTGNMLILKDCFGFEDLAEKLSDVKKERVDKQYYADFEIAKEEVEILLQEVEEFIMAIKLIIEEIKPEKIKEVRARIDSFS